MQRSRRFVIVVAIGGTVVAVGGIALAATPQSGEWRAAVGSKYGLAFAVKGSSIVAATPAGAIGAPSNSRCNSSALILKATKIKISGGKFSYDGKAYVDYYRAKSKLGRLVWSGTFTSATRAKGKARFTSNVTPVLNRQTGVWKFTTKKCDSAR